MSPVLFFGSTKSPSRLQKPIAWFIIGFKTAVSQISTVRTCKLEKNDRKNKGERHDVSGVVALGSITGMSNRWFLHICPNALVFCET